MNTIFITKIESARRQLCSAIELWFADADPVSIHTLAAASYQVIHDINRRDNGPDLLLDSKLIKEQYRKEFVNQIKRSSNFFKHADKEEIPLSKAFEFEPESNINFIIYAIFGLKSLGQQLSTEEIAFETWQIIQNPDLLTDEGFNLFSHTFPVNVVDSIRSGPKSEFFKNFKLLSNKTAIQ